MNLQNSKVGNIGDILKHAALVNLADLLANRNSSVPIHHLDTHTYRLTAPLPDSEAWKKNVAELCEKYPTFDRYIDLEGRALNNGVYHCSTQLVLDVLETKPHLYLAEKETAEREAIISELKAISNLPGPTVLDDMHKYAEHNGTGNPGPVLALIDPHYVDESGWLHMWGSVSSFIKRVHDNKCDGIILVYNWQPSNGVSWQIPVENFVGPISTMSMPTGKGNGHHHLSVYSTTGIRESAENVLQGLGWIKNKGDLMQKLKDALERMQAVMGKCTLTTLNNALKANYGWDAVSACGATEAAQAHVTTSEGETTKRWYAEKYAAVRTIVARAQLVKAPDELKKLLGIG